MWIFRNKELVRQLQVSVVILVLAAGSAGMLLGRRECLMILGSGVFWCGLHLLWQRKRYLNIRQLSDQLDEILHGKDTQKLEYFQEGELGVLRDQIQKMTVRLREQAKLLEREKAFLADSLADVSHQIRTPLTALNLILERLKSRGLEEKQKQVLVREAQQMLEKMEWLVTTLLKMSKLDAGAITLNIQHIELESFLREAMAPLEIPMEVRGKTFQIRGAARKAFLGDYSWTMEAVSNVLKNGMEHTPQGGVLLIDCQENPLYTEIKVTDSGKGIPKEDLPHLFERFYRGKDAKENSFGIGLALAQRILTRENGVIWAQNGENGGGQFVMRFYKTIL